MAAKSRKKPIFKTVSSAVDISCSSCKKPNLISSIFKPFKPKKPSQYYHASAKTTVTDKWCSDTSSSPFCGSQKAVAVEKQSDNPYLDFRQSMLQMIVENQIYSKEDLRELLNCFLSLNAPYHHGIIIKAFTEIWDGAVSSVTRTGAAAPPPFAAGYGFL